MSAQQTSRITLVLVSANTNASYYLREEIATALAMARDDEKRHRIVPIYLNAACETNRDVPYGLRARQGLTIANQDDLAPTARQLFLMLQPVKAV
jgi:hypothetical protein